jgi:pantothenate kinase
MRDGAIVKEKLGDAIRLDHFEELTVLSKGLYHYIDKHIQGVFKVNFSGEREYLREVPEGLDIQSDFLLNVFGTGNILYHVKKGQPSTLLVGNFYSGITSINLASLITGVDDFHTLMEMANRGDRFKCDFGILDVPMPDELKFMVPPFNVPIIQFTKVTKKKVESGEITHDDIVASIFSAQAVMAERTMN